MLEMIALQFQLIRSMPLEEQVANLKKLLAAGENPHPTRRFEAEVAAGAIKYRLLKLNQIERRVNEE